jgi:hypothetical protein
VKTDGWKCLGFLAMGIVLLSLPVQAQSLPAECTSFRSEIAYDSGVATGINIVAQAWAGINENCYRLDEFEEIIINNLMDYQLPSGASQYTICRYSGHVEGMLQKIDELYAECHVLCSEEGSLIGEISAICYCELALGLDGLYLPDYFVRRPASFCNVVFAAACDLRFTTVSRTYVNPSLDNPATPDVNEGECALRTDLGDDPLWIESWNETRTIQCTYEMESN